MSGLTEAEAMEIIRQLRAMRRKLETLARAIRRQRAREAPKRKRRRTARPKAA